MTIMGTGLDIIRIERIEEALDKWGNRFIEKIFTPHEIAYCQGQKRYAQHYAARFAAKEATFKMLGTGLRGLSWLDIEIRKNTEGKPSIFLMGSARILAEENGVRSIHLSLTHEKDYAVAQVIGEGES